MKFNRFLITALVLGLAAYWLALFVGTHVPLPVVKSIGRSDKLLHWASYTGLSFLLTTVVSLRHSLTWRTCLIVALGLAAYAALDELLQIPIPGRHADVWDWGADVGGVFCGLVTALAIRPIVASLVRT